MGSRILRSREDLQAVRSLFQARLPGQGETGAAVTMSHLCVRDAQGLRRKPHLVQVSGSKSFTNRALVLAALAQGQVELTGMLLSDDSYWGLDCLIQLGFVLEFDADKKCLFVRPWTPAVGSEETTRIDLQFGMAGTLARFFPAVLLNLSHSQSMEHVEFFCDGECRLRERPLADLVVALRRLGARIQGESLPLSIWPSRLTGETVISGAKSGQFFSGLILAAAGAKDPVTIRREDLLVQPNYVRMTLDAAEAFGACLEADADLSVVEAHPVPSLQPAGNRYAVEADASTACYFIALAVLWDLDLCVSNLGTSTRQPDVQFVAFLERLGAKFLCTPDTVRHVPGLPVSDRGWPALKGGFRADFNGMSDQALTAAVMALFVGGTDPIEVTGVAHIRKHESDRVACLCANLRELGVSSEEKDDGFVIFPLGGQQLQGVWRTHRDHRFAMCGFLLATRFPNVILEDPACCEKTAPHFFLEMEKMGVVFDGVRSPFSS